MNYFLFSWKKAVSEQKKFQKAQRYLLCSGLNEKKKNANTSKKNSLTVVCMLIKAVSHTDLAQFYCNVLKSTY